MTQFALFTLYGTLGCHLCELAEAQLALLLETLQSKGQPIEIECVDISVSDELINRYGERIPVLRRAADDAELNWPFVDEVLREFLQT